MNNVSEQLLQAMDIIMDEKLTQLAFDKTIQAIVYSIVDLNTGEYKVRYNGNIFTAYASDVSKTYKLNDAVYVQVPEGNFSNKKLITAKINSDSLSDNEITDLANQIIEVSPTFDALYGGIYTPSEAKGVIAGADPGSAGSEIYVCPELDSESGYHKLFQQYANTYEYIRIKASFLTQFHSEHNKGNYGIEIEFYTKKEPVKYRLDVQNFNGNPYGFSVYSPQSIVLKVQKNYLTGLKSIKLFEENFKYDEIIKNGQATGTYNTILANIFVKDVSVQYVDKKDLSNTTYYLMISTPRGIAFTDQINSLSLVGKLIYQGSDIMSTKNCSCQWYERDLSIMAGSDEYSKTAGYGWKPLKDQTSNTLTLNSDDVFHQQKYKLVTIYNDKVILTAETELWNNTNEYSYSLEQVTEGDDIKLQLRNNLSDEQLQGIWYLSYPDSSYSSVLQGEKQSEVSISSYLQYSFVTFYCAVYNSTDQYLGTLEHTIMNSEDQSDVTISYTGEDSFRYDANGDVTIEDSEQDRTLAMNLTWREGYGTSYSVEWLLNGYKIENDRNQAYSPSDSMMSNIWVDNNDILHYNIKQKYKVNNNNNIITIKITTITQSIYTFNKEIIFLKDGDQGTNGTTYIIAIRPCDTNGAKVSGFQAIRYNGTWQDTLRLRCYVYKDGELINNDPKHSITYEWSYKNLLGESREYSDRVIVRGEQAISATSESNLLDFYTKVSVAIDGEVYLYASYPVNVIIGDVKASDVNIDDIPSYIKYNSSGLVPSFYSNEINFYYQDKSYNSNIISANSNLLTIVDRDSKRYLEPVDAFIFENIENNSESNIAVLKCQIPNTENWIIHPIVMYLDTYGNEAINGWDGTTLDTGDGNYVFAPQVGAGKKESDNTFTGVVMGKDSGQQKIGLYGYQKGVNTFGFKEDGTAFIGAQSGGGQIQFDGNNATIQGGGGGDSDTGMTITLAKRGSNEDAIKLGKGNFKVTYDGTMYAVQGVIGGTGRGTNDSGWKITTGRLYSGTNRGYIELNSANDSNYFIFAGSSTAENANFSVRKDGTLTAKSGNIGSWQITSSSLQSSNGRVGMAPTGNQSFWAGDGAFYVTPGGYLYSSNANISGTISADGGEIGGWTIGSNYLQGGNTTLHASGTIETNTFAIKNGSRSIGELGNITGNDGSSSTVCVGISSNSNSIVLETNRNIRLSCRDFYIDASGSQYGIQARFA